MTITAAEIEASGWVLRLTLTAALGSFASYTLDPDGAPRITLTSSHPGFVKSGGQAVSGTLPRTLIGTKPLRLPVNPASPTSPVIDETDLGGGSIRVRIALSEHVYATDTGLSLAVLANWRTGEAAFSGISVTNNSTIVAPIPIMRWALLPYQVTAGVFTLAMFVVSHHPVGFEPVAGVKFTITDGTTVKTIWTTALSTDNSYGDNLRCYTASIDPATATALTAGLLRCDAEVYPWLGAMRTTDPAGTRSMTTLRTDGFNTDAASPWVIGYDPAGTRYSAQYVFVDPVNGTATAAAAMVQPTLAAAKAVAPAARAKDIRTAYQAGYLANRTLAAANGQASQSRSIDGMQIVLAAGTHAPGTTTVTTGIATAEIPVRIVGDPADGDPRNNCILPSAANGLSRVTRVLFQNMTALIGVSSFGSNIEKALFDNCIVTAKSGSESDTTAPFTDIPPAGQWNLGLARTKWWKTRSNIGGGNSRAGFVRGCEVSRNVTGVLFAVKNRWIPAAEDGFIGATVGNAFEGWPTATLASQVEDIIVAFNDLRSLRGSAWTPSTLPAAAAGTPNRSLRRVVYLNNICERVGSDPSPFYAFGEDASWTMSYNIIEGNTFVGDRSNTFYSDPLPTTIADTNSQLNQAFVNRVANNAFDWLPTKHDDFNDPQTISVRGAGSNGYRPQMIEAWSMLYGVGHEANVDTRRGTAASPNNFPLQFSGPRSLTGYGGAFAPLYADDKSILGTAGASATGGGDYSLQAGSPLLARVTRGNVDVDFVGTPRPALADAGAFERPTAALEGGVARVVVLMAAASITTTAPAATLVGLSARIVTQMAAGAIVGTPPPGAVLAGLSARVATRMEAGTLIGVPPPGAVLSGSSARVVTRAQAGPVTAAPGAAILQGDAARVLSVMPDMVLPERVQTFVRVDRVLDLGASDGRAFWVGGVPGAAWYRIGRAWPWTIDLDTQGAAYVEVRWAEPLMAPIICEPVVQSDGGLLEVSDLVASADYSRFMVKGSGGYVTLNVEAGGQGEKDVIRLRIRAKVSA